MGGERESETGLECWARSPAGPLESPLGVRFVLCLSIEILKAWARLKGLSSPN